MEIIEEIDEVIQYLFSFYLILYLYIQFKIKDKKEE